MAATQSSIESRAIVTQPSMSSPANCRSQVIRRYSWPVMLESGEFNTPKKSATRKGDDDSYVSRIVNLTTPEPEIVVAIGDATLPPEPWVEQWGSWWARLRVLTHRCSGTSKTCVIP